MPTKWDSFRSSVKRLGEDFDFPTATFYNYTTGTYDPDSGDMSGQTRTEVATETVEYVPPTMDTTVDVDGTSFSWDTSIRFADSDGVADDLKPLGEDNDKPTEVEIPDTSDGSTTVYQLHGYSIEEGSGMIMCRLVEL